MGYNEFSERLYIDGEWRIPASRGRITAYSPSTEDPIGEVPDGSAEDIDNAVNAARRCIDNSSWPHLTMAERAGWLRKAANAVRLHKDEIAQVTAAESGLPLVKAALPMSLRAAQILDYYADMGDTLAVEEERQGDSANVTVRREPVGVVGLITPWNAPFPLAHFSLAPALLAGCAIVLKPAPESPLHAQVLAKVYDSIGLPKGVLNVVPAGREVSEALVRHRGVDKITFTGSTLTGQLIGGICGSQIKRFSLELGGKSAAIILDDVNLAQAMPMIVGAAVQNNCQACVGQTRILVPASREDEFIAAFVAEIHKVILGDPFDPSVDMGPLISQRQRDRSESYIRIGKEEGASIVTGGGRPAHLNRGWFVEPTVFRNVTPDMRIAQEEIFGPVFCVIPYDSDDQAVAIANNSLYGLAGTAWTSDPERGMAIARRVRTGNFGVNIFGLELSSPFGGFKQSGMGRQLGPEGLNAYQELKSIYQPQAAPNVN